MDKKYMVSVITPLHDTNIDVFKVGIESIRKQTIGFENLQWIVVCHNNDEQLDAQVHALLDEYDNVIVKELHNDAKTPSSPRNYGLQFVEADYVGFLDADDSFLPDCMEVVLREMKAEQVQITSFRREYELESSDSRPVTEIVLWNQTMSKIVMDRDNYDDEKMFSGVCGMVTSRLYDYSFLMENKLFFDEEVLFGEDFLFNIEAFGHARKVLYLPQHIGYHYFINSGSLVQKGKKSPELLIQYARGYKKIFDAGLRYGFYMQAIISRLCVVLSNFLAVSTDLTLEDRLQIKEILEPYILMTQFIPPNKVYPEKKAYENYHMPREVILNPENWCKADNEKLITSEQGDVKQRSEYNLLYDILSKNVNTDFGKRYGFGSIITMEGYTARVPVSNETTYAPLIKLTTKIGESGIFVSEPIKFYSVRLGADCRETLFPHTEHAFQSFATAVRKMLNGKRSYVALENRKKSVLYNDGTYRGAIWNSVIHWLYHEDNRKGYADSTLMKLVYDPEANEISDCYNIVNALLDPDIEQIVAHTVADFVEALTIITSNYPLYLGYVEKKDKARADELRGFSAEGRGFHNLKRIWPKLERIVAKSDGKSLLAAHMIRKYLKGVRVETDYILSDEGLIGKRYRDTNLFEFCYSNAFFELLPTDVADACPILAEQAEIGKEYEIVITTQEGLYRYRTGYVINVMEMADGYPLFICSHILGEEIRYRHENENICIQETLLSEILIEAIDRYGFMLYDFAFADLNRWNGSDRLELLVTLEPFPFKKSIEMLQAIDKKELEEFIDSRLCERLPEYRKCKEEGKTFVVVEYGEPQTGLLYRDLLEYSDDYQKEQIVLSKYLDTPKRIKFYRANTI